MDNGKLTDLFNALIEINNDRIECYATAAKLTDKPELKVLFIRLIHTSQKCKLELINEINCLGETPAERNAKISNFYKTWMDVIASLHGEEHTVVMNSLCNWGVGYACDAYCGMLSQNNKWITARYLAILRIQHERMKQDCNKVMNLQIHGAVSN